jgi:hypothetical protein
MRYPGEFAAAQELAARDFLTRQALVGRYGEREFHGEVVVQKVGGAMTLIGVTPFGSQGVRGPAGRERGQGAGDF